MSNSKISQLTSATTPLAGTETLPIAQSGSTKQVSVDNLTTGKTVYAKNVNLTAGRLFLDQDYQITWQNGATNRGRIYVDSGNTIGFENGSGNTTRMLIDNSGNVTFSTGNLIQGTAAKGINFTANTPAAGMTSQLLNWYEEGTWTPVVYFGGGNTGMSVTVSGNYTRIGRLLTLRCSVVFSAKGSSTGTFQIGGLPFTNSIVGSGTMGFNYGWASMPSGGVTFIASSGNIYAMAANNGNFMDNTYFGNITAINDITISCMI